MELVAKCFCEDQDGSKQIFCENDGKFTATDSCDYNEWCVGPKNQNEALYGPTSDLCKDVDISCGGSTLYPSCNHCPRKDEKEWCGGDCYLDEKEDTCNEIHQYAKVGHSTCSYDTSSSFIANILGNKKSLMEGKSACSKDKDCLGVYQRSCDLQYAEFKLCYDYIEIDASYESCVYKKDSVRGYPSDFIEVGDGVQCNESNVNVLEEFIPPSQSLRDVGLTRKKCKDYCSKNDQCWGCIKWSISSLKMNAIHKCGDQKPSKALILAIMMEKFFLEELQIRNTLK